MHPSLKHSFVKAICPVPHFNLLSWENADQHCPFNYSISLARTPQLLNTCRRLKSCLSLQDEREGRSLVWRKKNWVWMPAVNLPATGGFWNLIRKPRYAKNWWRNVLPLRIKVVLKIKYTASVCPGTPSFSPNASNMILNGSQIINGKGVPGHLLTKTWTATYLFSENKSWT